MNQEKVVKLLNDEEFLNKLVEKVNEEEVRSLFSEYGEELTLDDVKKIEQKISESIKADNDALDLEFLDSISGGISVKNWLKTCLYSQVCTLKPDEQGKYNWDLDTSKIFSAFKSGMEGIFLKGQIKKLKK